MHDNPQQTLRYAYFAELFDGEGSFCICKQSSEYYMKKTKRKNPHYHPLVRMGLTNRTLLDEMQRLFQCGKVYDEGIRKGRPDHKPMYRFQTTSRDDCVKIINLLLPELTEKKSQALLVKKFCEGWKSPFNRQSGIDPEELHRREELYYKVRKLNTVGVAATTESLRPERVSDSLNSMET